MKTFSRRFVLALLCICLLTQSSCKSTWEYWLGTAKKEALGIGHIKDLGDMMGRCGCALQFPIDRNYNSSGCIFIADETGAALMNINGKDTKMQIVYHSSPDKQFRVGDKFSTTFVGGGVQAKFNFQVTETCGEDVEKCKLIYVTSNITLTKGRLEKKYTGIGACGCK